MNTIRFKVSRWIFLSLSVILNGFIILYSCLPMNATAKINSAFTNVFASIINTFSKRTVETIPLKEISLDFSDDKYNSIPGYATNIIPLGSAKEIECTYSPLDATNKNFRFYSNDDLVKINQNGSKASIVGLKEGHTKIYVENAETKLIDSCDVYVCDPIAPVNFSVSVESTEINIHGYADLIFDIDGGPLGHNELHNSRYYDIRKLSYTSSNPSVLEVSELGVIKPLSLGVAKITVSNGTLLKSVDVEVVDGEPFTPYTDLHISCENVTYENDFINNAHSLPLKIYDGTTLLDNKDFIFESSNELLVNVDKYGVVRGFRKSITGDETATITAKSKITGDVVNFTVVVREQLPTHLAYAVIAYEQVKWNTDIFTTCVGDEVKIQFYLEPSAYNKTMNISSSDENIISTNFQGNYANLTIKTQGSCTISFSYALDNSLKGSIKFTVLEAGALKTDEISDLNYSFRKIFGHAAMFMIAQLATIITIFMFLYDKKLWLISAISVATGLFMAVISEVIEGFVPQRSCRFLDMVINFSGVIVGAVLFIVFLLICKIIKEKKKNKL